MKLILAILDAAIAFVQENQRIMLVPVFFFFINVVLVLMYASGLFASCMNGVAFTTPGGDNYLT